MGLFIGMQFAFFLESSFSGEVRIEPFWVRSLRKTAGVEFYAAWNTSLGPDQISLPRVGRLLFRTSGRVANTPTDRSIYNATYPPAVICRTAPAQEKKKTVLCVNRPARRAA